jgi:hypothetical protein
MTRATRNNLGHWGIVGSHPREGAEARDAGGRLLTIQRLAGWWALMDGDELVGWLLWSRGGLSR